MKISKSFKIYIHIILSLLLANTVLADDRLSKNVIIHDKPINIKELKFKDYNLQEVCHILSLFLIILSWPPE